MHFLLLRGSITAAREREKHQQQEMETTTERAATSQRFFHTLPIENSLSVKQEAEFHSPWRFRWSSD